MTYNVFDGTLNLALSIYLSTAPKKLTLYHYYFLNTLGCIVPNG